MLEIPHKLVTADGEPVDIKECIQTDEDSILDQYWVAERIGQRWRCLHEEEDGATRWEFHRDPWEGRTYGTLNDAVRALAKALNLKPVNTPAILAVHTGAIGDVRLT